MGSVKPFVFRPIRPVCGLGMRVAIGFRNRGGAPRMESKRNQRKMNTTQSHDTCIEVCNQLLRGEISAVETYEQAIHKFADHPAVIALERMRDEHQDSVTKLRANVVSMGGQPATDSGAWGVFAKSVEGAAAVLGESSAVAALRQGEEHGIDEYSSALENPEVLHECKTLISEVLLPRLRSHVQALESIAA